VVLCPSSTKVNALALSAAVHTQLLAVRQALQATHAI